jgi:hypothetical protein
MDKTLNEENKPPSSPSSSASSRTSFSGVLEPSRALFLLPASLPKTSTPPPDPARLFASRRYSSPGSSSSPPLSLKYAWSV